MVDFMLAAPTSAKAVGTGTRAGLLAPRYRFPERLTFVCKKAMVKRLGAVALIMATPRITASTERERERERERCIYIYARTQLETEAHLLRNDRTQADSTNSHLLDANKHRETRGLSLSVPTTRSRHGH